MIYVILVLSLLFLAIGFILNEKNAKYLLSGYNTLPDEEKKKFDLTSFISYFKRFHLFLGVSTLVVGLVLHFTKGETFSGIFLGIYPIIAYLFFVWTGSKFSKGVKRANKVGFYILLGTLVLVTGLLFAGLKNDKLEVHGSFIEVQGMYGKKIPSSDIVSLQLIGELPPILTRKNGFSLGETHKGYFETDQGETLKLILNADNRPYLQFQLENGKKIIYTDKYIPARDLLLEIQSKHPGLQVKDTGID